MYGSEKRFHEPSRIKRLAYGALGEINVPGRLRAYHVMRKVSQMGLARKKALKMIDAGCGRGNMSIYFARQNPGWQVTGIEYDPERFDIATNAKEKLGLRNMTVVRGDLTRLRLEGGHDLIISCDVMEHIEDDMSVFRNLYGALKPGGVLVLTFPSIPQRKHLKLVKWREKKIGFKNSDYGHVRDGYSIPGIEKSLREAGFREVRSQYTFGFWGTLCFDIFFVLGDNRPNPVLYMLAFPFLMSLAALDVYLPSKQGSALIVVATK